MSKWFVYCGANYYPYGKTVEADTPEEAARAVAERDYEDGVVVLVFPFAALAHRHGGY